MPKETQSVTTMMQQIAALKTEIATESPSKESFVEPPRGTEFSAVMRDSKQSAFEQARERSVKISEQQKETPYTQPVEEKAQPNADTNISETQVDDTRSEQRSNAQSNDTDNAVKNEKSQAQPSSSDSQSASGVKSASDDVKSQDVVEPSSKELDDSDLLSFNYVDYVTQVKNINTDVAQQLESDGNNVSLLLNEEIASGMFVVEDIQNMQLDKNLESINIGDEKAESLQAIDENIDKVLTQITTDVDRDLAGVEGQKLIADGLKTNGLDGVNVLTNEAAGSDVEFKQISDISLKIAADKKLDNELGVIINPDTEIKSDDIATLFTSRKEALGLGDTVNGEAIDSDIVANHLDRDLLDKKNVLVSSLPDTKQSNTNPLNTIASLTEQAELDSIKNLAQRVAQVISEVSPDTPKGSEFIAALQAGVKEFKAQLADGREPGIDLKALVVSASEKAEVTINAQQVNKLEQSIQQFSNALNLAVNGQQQPQQVNFSPSEAVVAEKISQSMNETSKAVTQQTGNSALDKAINIMKPDGQQQMADRVRWMINSRTSAAEIRLDPPELGAMQVRINMSGEAAAVSFVVQSQQAKDALDMAAPRLKELFGEQGIELGQSSVEQDSGGQQGDSPEDEHLGGTAQSIRNTANAEEAVDVNTQAITQRIAGTSIGGIDYYA